MSRGGWLALLAPLACSGPVQLYPGPPLPEDRVATLELETAPGPAIQVLRIDGAAVYGESWALAPGPHEIWVQLETRRRFGVFWRNLPVRRRAYCPIRFEAVAGERYEVRPEFHVDFGARVKETGTGRTWRAERCSQVLPRSAPATAPPPGAGARSPPRRCRTPRAPRACAPRGAAAPAGSRRGSATA